MATNGLDSAKIDLKNEIYQSFLQLYSLAVNTQDGKKLDPLAMLDKLSADLTNSIDKYTRSAQVNIDEIAVTVDQPIPVAVAINTGAGSTTSVGSTTKKGLGKLQ